MNIYLFRSASILNQMVKHGYLQIHFHNDFIWRNATVKDSPQQHSKIKSENFERQYI